LAVDAMGYLLEFQHARELMRIKPVESKPRASKELSSMSDSLRRFGNEASNIGSESYEIARCQ
jgi:hypothetical protein